MDINDMVLVSVDDHVVEPPDLFEGRLPAKYAGPRAEVHHQRRRHQRVALRGPDPRQRRRSTPSPVGRRRSTASSRPRFDEIRPGCWDIDERVEDMNANGVLGSLCFPSFPQFCGQLFARTEDKDVALAMLRAYNDWHIDEWCGTHPGRFIPLRAPGHLGPRGAGRRGAPRRGQGLPRGHLLREPREARLAEHPLATTGTRSGRPAATSTVVVCLHIGSSSALVITSRRRADRLPDHAAADEHRAGRRRPRVVAGAAEVPAT